MDQIFRHIFIDGAIRAGSATGCLRTGMSQTLLQDCEAFLLQLSSLFMFLVDLTQSSDVSVPYVVVFAMLARACDVVHAA